MARALAVALALMPGLVAAQPANRTLELSHHTATPEECLATCIASCTMAYYFPAERPPRCMLTDDAEPDLSVPRPRTIWPRRLGRRLTWRDLLDHYPQTAEDNRDSMPPEVRAEFERRLAARTATRATPAEATARAGAAACAAARIESGTRWIIRYRGANQSHYFQHGNFLCSPGRDRFMALGTNFLEFFNCDADFTACRPYPPYDGHLGAPLGPDAHGATQRWPVTEGPGGREIGIIVARM